MAKILGEKFIGKPELIKANDDSKYFICTQCGECCHIREDKNITEDEEASYKNYLFKHYGIIYLANLAQITINVWPEEKKALEKEAKKNGITIKIMPKRAVYDKSSNKLIILDYFIDHDICPFYDEKLRKCNAYNIRPSICRSYPLTTTENYGKCKYKKTDFKEYKEEMIQAKISGDKIKRQKNIIKGLINDKKIIIPDSISEKEMQQIIETADIVELRMDK